MSEVNKVQYGGDHYRASIQHWDFAELNGMGYLESAATKYACRARKKHETPILDWEKAKHYTEKLKELHLKHNRQNRRLERPYGRSSRDANFTPMVIPFEDFIIANELDEVEEAFTRLHLCWTNVGHLDEAIQIAEEQLEFWRSRP